MTITRQIQINTASDTCQVAKTPSGAITIGSVRIEYEELEEFIKILRTAIVQVQNENPAVP